MATELRTIPTETWIGAVLSLFELNEGTGILIAIEFKSPIFPAYVGFC
jgi:hypothetical protein